jgi:hypothetical protein
MGGIPLSMYSHFKFTNAIVTVRLLSSLGIAQASPALVQLCTALQAANAPSPLSIFKVGVCKDVGEGKHPSKKLGIVFAVKDRRHHDNT